MVCVILDELKTYGPDRCAALSVAGARAYTRRIARAHGENFSVATWLLPRGLREDFFAVYAFCRWADDLADEAGGPERALGLLAWWREELDRCFAGRPRHPVFVALGPTLEKHGLPREPFTDLLDAFVRDQTVCRYENWPQLLDYCTRSANPVGRLVLMMMGYRDQERFALADATCTALQLTNFWQDVRRDLMERGRVYLPADLLAQHGADLDQMAGLARLNRAALCDSCAVGRGGPAGAVAGLLRAYRAALGELAGRTRPLFDRGRALWPEVRPQVRGDLQLFTLGLSLIHI